MSYEVHALNHVLFSCSKYFMDVSGGWGRGGFTMVTYIANIVSGYIVPYLHMHPQTNPTYIFIKLQPEKDNYNVPIILHTNVKQLPSPLTFPFEM